MWLIELLIAAAPLAGLGAAVASAKHSRHPLALQWGRFVNQRPGIKNDHERVAREKQNGTISPDSEFDGWADEPDVVEYVDYRYWLRLQPNPGINLPVVGYWSRARGRQRPGRPGERR